MNIKDFDPSSPGVDNGNYFGLPFTIEDASLVLISAPWDVTTSYGDGTARGPEAIISASLQIDLFDLHNHAGWRKGIASMQYDDNISVTSSELREVAVDIITALEEGTDPDDKEILRKTAIINEGSESLNNYIYAQSATLLGAGKLVGVVGGDHSVPLGLIKALGERNNDFGILHIDAHADLRQAYEGFTYSHASIMYNALEQIPSLSSLVQVGVRDICEQEYELAQVNPRIWQFNDYALNEAVFKGENWDSICGRIVDRLPPKVYVSFDIDGLSPDNCPNTGTPVAGGLSFHQAVYLVAKVRESGREIIGFDLCEVSPNGYDEYDANIGARVLFKLCNIALKD